MTTGKKTPGKTQTSKTRKQPTRRPVPSEARRAPRRGEQRESAGGGPTPSATQSSTEQGAQEDGPVHFLDGLRCSWCKALNASWLWPDGSTVECAECGQTSLVVGHIPTDGRERA